MTDMDLAVVERLMEMLEKSSLTSLDVTEGDLRIRLSKSAVPEAFDSIAGAIANDRPETALEPGLVAVVAGLSGTFYRAPAPGAEPYVTEGQTIAEGDRLALIEAMKMLNPVEAEISGIVRRVCLADATPVEPGAVLFEIEKIA